MCSFVVEWNWGLQSQKTQHKNQQQAIFMCNFIMERNLGLDITKTQQYKNQWEATMRVTQVVVAYNFIMERNTCTNKQTHRSL
jgi:hypothetical protein